MPPTDSEILTTARALWPSLTVTAASDATLTAWLPWARQIASGDVFGGVTLIAQANLVAHIGMRLDATSAGASGPVTSVSTGALSVSYGSAQFPLSSSMDAALAMTGPGQTYLAIRDTIATIQAPFVV